MNGPGPLHGIRILEIESIGPGPFAAMVLADLGASVLRVARPTRASARLRNPVLERGRCGTLSADLTSAAARERVLGLVERADALLEGYRPNVMERLGLSPDTCLARNPRLVYGRITGWGQSGPLKQSAGHDINYIALSGALHACGTIESGPIPPLNLVGDFGGGGMLLALGVVCGLLEAKVSGRGQVVDAAMLDGSALLMSMIYGLRANGQWPAARAGNILDGSAWFYTCYACADGGWMAVGAIEPEFRRLWLQLLGLADDVDALLATAHDDPDVRARIAARFSSQPRAHWEKLFENTDACVTPVLTMDEAPEHPQNRARGVLRRIDGAIHPAPAPRFSRTTAEGGGDRASQLADWGLDPL